MYRDAPLRAVVGEEWVPQYPGCPDLHWLRSRREKLACGHLIRPDGHVKHAHRRCHECRRAIEEAKERLANAPLVTEAKRRMAEVLGCRVEDIVIHVPPVVARKLAGKP